MGSRTFWYSDGGWWRVGGLQGYDIVMLWALWTNWLQFNTHTHICNIKGDFDFGCRLYLIIRPWVPKFTLIWVWGPFWTDSASQRSQTLTPSTFDLVCPSFSSLAVYGFNTRHIGQIVFRVQRKKRQIPQVKQTLTLKLGCWPVQFFIILGFRCLLYRAGYFCVPLVICLDACGLRGLTFALVN